MISIEELPKLEYLSSVATKSVVTISCNFTLAAKRMAIKYTNQAENLNKTNPGMQKYNFLKMQFFSPFMKFLLIHTVYCPTESQCMCLASQSTVTSTFE